MKRVNRTYNNFRKQFTEGALWCHLDTVFSMKLTGNNSLQRRRNRNKGSHDQNFQARRQYRQSKRKSKEEISQKINHICYLLFSEKYCDSLLAHIIVPFAKIHNNFG